MTHDAKARTMKLSRLGKIAAQFSTMTRPTFYGETFTDARRAAEKGSEWEQLVDERIAGLQAIKAQFYELMNEADE